jgi:DNA-binding transcriptional regulator YhcF (GntR family)
MSQRGSQGQPALLRIDLSRPVPPYKQLRAQVSGQVASGQLDRGTRLPAVRQLAGDFGLAPGTVGRAYSELENEGEVISRGRRGTSVSGAAAGAGRCTQQQLAAADQFVAAVRKLDLTDEAAEAAVRQGLARRPAS